MGRLRCLAVVGGLLVASTLSWSAWAQDNATAQARALFNAGAKAYETGKYPAAIQAFEEAYRLSPREGLLFSIAQAHRRQYFVSRDPAHLTAAVEHYQNYLAVATEANRRGEAADALAQLEPLVARLEAEQAQGENGSAERTGTAKAAVTQLMVTSPTPRARLELDGRDVGALPYIAGVEPGRRRLAVVAPGFRSYEREVNVAQGSIVPLDIELEPEPGRLDVRVEKRARIIANGQLVGVSPLAAPVELAPGKYVILAQKNGHRLATQHLTIERGQAQSVSMSLRTSSQRRLSYVTLGVGGTAVIVGGFFAAGALDRERRAKDLIAEQSKTNLTEADANRYDDLRSERDQMRAAAFSTTSAGVAFGALGAVLYLLDRPDATQTTPLPTEEGPRPRPGNPELAVGTDRYGAFATVSGRF